MTERTSDDYLTSEKQEPVPSKKDGSEFFFVGEDEIGLLDIVLMDAISNGDGAVNR